VKLLTGLSWLWINHKLLGSVRTGTLLTSSKMILFHGAFVSLFVCLIDCLLNCSKHSAIYFLSLEVSEHLKITSKYPLIYKYLPIWFILSRIVCV
jgi:hypothetical protein